MNGIAIVNYHMFTKILGVPTTDVPPPLIATSAGYEGVSL